MASCRHCCRKPPSQTLANAELWVDLLQYFPQQNVQAKFPEEFGLMKETIDEALRRTWEAYKAKKITKSVWWSSVRDCAGLLLPVADVDAALSCTTK